MDERIEPMPDGREGACIPLPAGSGVWAVRGRTRWFRCNADTSVCECADFLAGKRRGEPLTPCSHLRALARHLAAGREAERLVVGALPGDAELRELFA